MSRVFVFLPGACALLLAGFACAAPDESEITESRHPAITPDLSETELPVSVRQGNIVAVPIPFSNPTLGNGLVGVTAYFHPQSEAQKAAQPPTVTGLAAMYTGNESWAVGLGHSAYWREDRWRFAGALGYSDVELPLLVPGVTSQTLKIDWLLKGAIAYGSLSRRFGSHWYGGLVAQLVDIRQEFSFELVAPDLLLGSSIRSVLLGPSLTYDTRDVPANAYTGRYFQLTAKASSKDIGSDVDYEAYSLVYRTYHQLLPSLVVAGEAAGCLRSDGAPLFDTCRIGLRGFASTDYMGKSSWRTQAELRWKWSRRWGVGAFAGVGQITESLISSRDHDLVPSYGGGLRFTVQPEQRIVMRLDYARSSDSDAWYLAVGEAF